MPSNCNGVSCFKQIFEKKIEFTSEVWVFLHFCKFCWFFLSAEPSQTILSIDRSEPRFESHTGGKIRKN